MQIFIVALFFFPFQTIWVYFPHINFPKAKEQSICYLNKSRFVAFNFKKNVYKDELHLEVGLICTASF